MNFLEAFLCRDVDELVVTLTVVGAAARRMFRGFGEHVLRSGVEESVGCNGGEELRFRDNFDLLFFDLDVTVFNYFNVGHRGW